MRTSTASIVPFPSSGARSFDRRPLKSFWAGLTCLVLVKHHETEKALNVSDDNDPIGAVWVPRAMLQIDPIPRGRFLVATMSVVFAQQKRLTARFIDPEKLPAEEAAYLAEAVAVAAQTRLRQRGFQQPLAYPGRNAFA